jgi:hypothetical protein
MLEKFQVARANSGDGTQPLVSPYVPNDPDIIKPSDDFTVQLTTISKSVLDQYGSRMKRGEYGNDYFVIMSHFGIGSNGGNMPSNTINLVQRVNEVDKNILSFWGERVRWIEDYRNKGSDGNAGRIYLGTSAFCQSIGKSSLFAIQNSLDEAFAVAGRLSPALAPFTTAASQALDGITNIVKKLTEHSGEIIKSQITLYPQTTGSLPAGNAYLQRGSYVLFFEETEIDNLHLTKQGLVVAGNGFTGTIPPYIIANIADGLIDAPDSEALNKAVGLDIREKYERRFALPTDPNQTGLGSILAEELCKIGESYRVYKKLLRYNELKGKSDITETEQKRLESIKEELVKLLGNVNL